MIVSNTLPYDLPLLWTRHFAWRCSRGHLLIWPVSSSASCSVYTDQRPPDERKSLTKKNRRVVLKYFKETNKNHVSKMLFFFAYLQNISELNISLRKNKTDERKHLQNAQRIYKETPQLIFLILIISLITHLKKKEQKLCIYRKFECFYCNKNIAIAC